jgi:hypothetical protein
LKLEPAIESSGGKAISVSVKDRQGNISRIDRVFSAAGKASKPVAEN